MPLEQTMAHLDKLYSGSSDPWGHETRAYEQEKYAATLAMIGPGPFESAIEIGCGIGAFSARIAPQCAHLVAIDCIGRAAKLARLRLAEFQHCHVMTGTAPDDLPAGKFDLIVLSEVLYYLTEAELGRLGRWIDDNSRPGALIVMVNWTGTTGEWLDGAAASGVLRRAVSNAHPLRSKSCRHYVIEVLHI